MDEELEESDLSGGSRDGFSCREGEGRFTGNSIASSRSAVNVEKYQGVRGVQNM